MYLWVRGQRLSSTHIWLECMQNYWKFPITWVVMLGLRLKSQESGKTIPERQLAEHAQSLSLQSPPGRCLQKQYQPTALFTIRGQCGLKACDQSSPTPAKLSLPRSPPIPSFSLSQCKFNKPVSKPSMPRAFKDLRLLNVKHLIIFDYFQ